MAAPPQQLMELQEAIRRNAEDLRDELAALDAWEAEMAAKEAANKKKTHIEPDLPPVRGTERPGAQPKKPKEDPIAVAKEQGNEYFRLCKYEDAARCYTKGIALDPDSSSMHVMYSNRAMCYLKMQLWDLAEKDATTCIQMNRTFVKAFFRRALARKAMGKLKDARADLETALVLSPGDKEAEAELKSVSALLQQQLKAEEAAKPAAATSGAAAKKKKLIIEEVEDEDDEPAAAATSSSSQSQSAPETAAMSRQKERELEEQRERDARHKRDQEEAKRVQEERAEQRRKAAEAEEARLKATRRTNSRIEEIEDEPSPPKPAAKPAKHADPAPAVRRIEVTKESLTTPKSFVEFEQQHAEIKKKAPLLLEYYLSLLPAAKWAAIFKSSMSSEILADVFETSTTASPENALSMLVGASTLPRLEELVMFMEDSDKAKGHEGINKALTVASSADAKQLASLRKVLE